MDTSFQKIDELIENAKGVVFFGGAGVSTESGIPDFRSKDGLYNQKGIAFDGFSPEYLLSHECLMEHADIFFEFYRQKMNVKDIQPNMTHKVLATMEQKGKLLGVITQNIDNLHQKAGSQRVYELHGSVYRNYCISCGAKYAYEYVLQSQGVPHCQHCGGLVRPEVTLYGEALPQEQVQGAINLLRQADLLIIGGTSLTVYPAAGFLSFYEGENIIVINRELLTLPMDMQGKHIFSFQESLGTIFQTLRKYY